MKICPACNNSYDDSLFMCPKCELYLIDNSPSNTDTRKRRIVKRADTHTQTANTQPHTNDNTVFQRGRNLSSDSPNMPAGTQYQRPRGRSRAVISAVLRAYIPLIMLVTAILLVIINWNSIREVLITLFAGALAGAFIFAFISVRYGRGFAVNAMTAGAVIGSLAALFLRNNMLRINVELAGLLQAFMPLVIMIAAIHFIIRSVLR